MATWYTLRAKNDSNYPGSFCIYQTVPEQETDKNLLSTAWFTKSCNPGSTITFKWTLDYNFVWSETGTLVPGVYFDASQVISAAPEDTTQNSIAFTVKNYAYTFDNTSRRTPQGSLGIYVDDTVPNGDSSIGIGMSGNPILVKQAKTNMSFVFTPHPKYWIAFGEFVPGEVIDVNVVNKPKEIIYDPNVYTKVVILGKDNTFQVENQKEFNKLSMLNKMQYSVQSGNLKRYKCRKCGNVWVSDVEPLYCPRCGAEGAYELL